MARKKERELLNSRAIRILDFLESEGGSATTNQIARETHIAFINVKAMLKKLTRWGILFTTELEDSSGKKPVKRYSINYDKILPPKLKS